MSALMIKKGATLSLIFALKNDDDSPLNLSGVTATSQVRDGAGTVIATLTLTRTSTPGQLTVQQATDSWPTGPLRMDIKLVSGGVVLKSDTQTIQVNEAMTE